MLYISYLQQLKIVFKKPSLKNNCFEVLLPKLLIRYSFVGLVVCTGGWKNSWWVKKVEAFLKILNSIALEQCLFSSTQYVYIQISFSMAVASLFKTSSLKKLLLVYKLSVFLWLIHLVSNYIMAIKHANIFFTSRNSSKQPWCACFGKNSFLISSTTTLPSIVVSWAILNEDTIKYQKSKW